MWDQKSKSISHQPPQELLNVWGVQERNLEMMWKNSILPQEVTADQTSPLVSTLDDSNTEVIATLSTKQGLIIFDTILKKKKELDNMNTY